MIIGVPKEIKIHEYRVGLTPYSVHEYTRRGHEVLVETNAGSGIGASDEEYKQSGAVIVDNAADIFAKAHMIVKVKEPQPHECKMLRKGQILYTYLHLAADEVQTRLLMESGAVAIAYETITDSEGRLPLLAPMSEVAGRMSIQAGAHCLEKKQGGRGVLLAGVPGVAPANILIIGGGVAGYNAARMAQGLGANVTILDKSQKQLRALDNIFKGSLRLLISNEQTLTEELKRADLVIGAALVAGAAAPKIIKKAHLQLMQKGAVIVDISIDQGGIAETSKPTTHDAPTFIVDDIVHYCVANMPGAVARTSAFALNAATLNYGLMLADLGWQKAIEQSEHLKAGLNICEGQITYGAVKEAFPHL